MPLSLSLILLSKSHPESKPKSTHVAFIKPPMLFYLASLLYISAPNLLHLPPFSTSFQREREREKGRPGEHPETVDRDMASLTGFIAFMVFVAALFQGTTAQKTHTVGDNLGWGVPQGDKNAYSSWAAKQTFNVGDTLVFNFVTGQHDVANVTKTVYDACNTNSAAPNSIKTGPANVTLTSEGDQYFICTVGPHCSLGQKVKISVNSSSGTTTPSGTPPGGTTTNPKSAASTLTIINFSMLVSVAIAFLY